MKQNNISCGKITDEAASFCALGSEKWKAQVWLDVIQNFEEKKIFKADETGLFYEMTSSQMLKFKGENYTNGKS